MKAYEAENVRLATENRQVKRELRELYVELERLFYAASLDSDAGLYNVVKFMEARWGEKVKGHVL